MCEFIHSINFFTYRIVNFDIRFSNRGAGILESFDEGVEFGFRNLNSGKEWIPLTFYSFRPPFQRDEDIEIGSESMSSDSNVIVNIRGHNVSFFHVRDHNANLKLCGSEIMQNNASLSFRWLQTVVSNSAVNADPAYLDNVNIRLSVDSSEEHVLLRDDFNSGTMIKYADYYYYCMPKTLVSSIPIEMYV